VRAQTAEHLRGVVDPLGEGGLLVSAVAREPEARAQQAKPLYKCSLD